MAEPIALKQITYNACPECNSPAIRVGVRTSTAPGTSGATSEIMQHCNGERWEYITFACMREDEFVPNFMRIETKRPCGNRPADVVKRQQRENAIQNILIQVTKLDVDEDFRVFLRRAIGTVRIED